jgi:hypothetical protein
MHRMQIAGARISSLMQISKSKSTVTYKRGIPPFDSSHGGKDMQTLYANEQIMRRNIPLI